MIINSLFTKKFIAVCFLAFAISFGLSYVFVNNILKVDYESTNSTPFSSRNTNIEIALIYFGCSICPSALDDRLPDILAKLSKKIKRSTDTIGYEFIFIGVSNENEIDLGLDYLQGIADFNEISLGNRMGNTIIQRYVWDSFDHPLSASTPQVIISKRVYDESDHVNERYMVLPYIVSEQIIIRKVGIKNIELLITEDGLLNNLL